MGLWGWRRGGTAVYDMHQDTWRMEDAVWSVLVAGYVLGYSLTMKSKNNDKIRVMIIITTISSMMSRHVVSTAPICGYRSVFGLLSEHVPKPPHMHRSHVGLGLIRTVHNSLLHEGLKYILQQGTCKRCGSLLTTTSRNLCCCFFLKKPARQLQLCPNNLRLLISRNAVVLV